jgi:hypothetical protein
MGFKKAPRLFFRGDTENAKNPLGKTAFYNSEKLSITIYVMNRHPKDVLRSLSHELVHHSQNCRGDLGNISASPGYAQSDDHMREMEREAYEVGNMCFRDWEDGIKNTIYYEHLQKGEIKMSTKDWRNKELRTILSEAWGFKFNTLQEFNEFNESGELQAEGEEELEEFADRGGRRKRAKPQGTGARVEPDAPFQKPPTEEDEDEPLKEAGDDTDADVTEEGRSEHDADSTKTDINEDSGAEEGEHYEHSSMHDEDHIKAIRHHLDALEHDEHYDKDHEELEEDKKTDPLKEAIVAILAKHLKG